eukprot:UC4_evm3s351
MRSNLQNGQLELNCAHCPKQSRWNECEHGKYAAGSLGSISHKHIEHCTFTLVLSLLCLFSQSRKASSGNLASHALRAASSRL